MNGCYLCGSIKHLTKDHIPPKNLFVPPLPDNLITVDCCNGCHKKFTLDDEAFRVFASSIINRSKAGEWIWKNKVMQSSFKRSPKLKKSVAKSLIPILINPTIPSIKLYGTRYPVDRAERYLIRITKGLMWHYYPEIKYSEAKFKVTMISPTQNIVDNTLSKFVYDERGNGVFRFWRVFYKSGVPDSVWVYVFYDGLMFMVEVN